MNRWITSVFVLSGCFALLICCAKAHSGNKYKEYAAEQVLISQGKEQMKTSLYVAGDKLRIDQRLPGSPQGMTIIVRQDKKLTWTLFPDKKNYLEAPLTEQDLQRYIKAPIGQGRNVSVKEEVLGKETVNGHLCTKKRIETTVEVQGQRVTTRSTVWLSDRVDIPLRTEDENGITMELRNLRPGPQDPALFEVPKGYTKASGALEAMGVLDSSMPTPDDNEIDQSSAPVPEHIRNMLEQHMNKGRPR